MFVLLFCALHFKYILLVLHLQFPEYPAAIANVPTFLSFIHTCKLL